jgi:hypothetical protein
MDVFGQTHSDLDNLMRKLAKRRARRSAEEDAQCLQFSFQKLSVCFQNYVGSMSLTRSDFEAAPIH